VVQAQFARWESLAAVLAEISITSKDVAAVQPYALFRDAIVVQQSEHAGHLNLEVHAANPVLVRFLELGSQFTDFPPRFEIVIGPLVALDMDDLSQAAEQKDEGSPYVDNVDRNVLTIK
jgi:hypothetical protein